LTIIFIEMWSHRSIGGHSNLLEKPKLVITCFHFLQMEKSSSGKYPILFLVKMLSWRTM